MEEEIRLNIRIADRPYVLYARPDVAPKIRQAVGDIQQEIEKMKKSGCIDMVEMLSVIALDQTIKNLSNA